MPHFETIVLLNMRSQTRKTAPASRFLFPEYFPPNFERKSHGRGILMSRRQLGDAAGRSRAALLALAGWSRLGGTWPARSRGEQFRSPPAGKTVEQRDLIPIIPAGTMPVRGGTPAERVPPRTAPVLRVGAMGMTVAMMMGPVTVAVSVSVPFPTRPA